MPELFNILNREFIYISYYFILQLRQIAGFWILGMLIGSIISVFCKDKIHNLFNKLNVEKWNLWGIIPASLLGVASPLCMYGTIPIAASFSKQGMRHDYLAAFMMTSILLNPQLIIYSASLGLPALFIRIISCTIIGILAGLLIYYFYKGKSFFNFNNFEPKTNRDTNPNLLLRFIYNFGRNIKATGIYFLIGILLSALFQRYVPADGFAQIFGKSNETFGILMAATLGVPLYACGGGTIPLIKEGLSMGMTLGSAATFMIVGPATKITNLGALKIVMGKKLFFLYLAFVIFFSIGIGFLINLII